MPRSYLLLYICGLLFLSCGKGPVYSEFQALDNGSWDRDTIKEFKISDLEENQDYEMFINVRNDNTYPYSNLFLITELEYPDGTTYIDTLEYAMANADGSWLGKGVGSIKENKLWYKENINFPVKGVYIMRIEHAMRKSGSVDGIVELPGITDIGVEIEKK
ncbi:gliding motility lipoprotein GldH [Muriicola sp.]|uniref:gliding motility lipoprotein GldH n=1 Tax=Muriicola sp. TaxID=2020856 RepID=UPI003C73A4C6